MKGRKIKISFMDEAKRTKDVDKFLSLVNKCRKCDHIQLMHCGKEQGCSESTLKTSGKHKWCSCKEYIPAENLEYFKWLYSKKGGSNE